MWKSLECTSTLWVGRIPGKHHFRCDVLSFQMWTASVFNQMWTFPASVFKCASLFSFSFQMWTFRLQFSNVDVRLRLQFSNVASVFKCGRFSFQMWLQFSNVDVPALRAAGDGARRRSAPSQFRYIAAVPNDLRRCSSTSVELKTWCVTTL